MNSRRTFAPTRDNIMKRFVRKVSETTFSPRTCRPYSVVETSKTRQRPIVRQRSCRLDRIFGGPPSSDSAQAQSAVDDSVRSRISCWTEDIGCTEVGRDSPSVQVREHVTNCSFQTTLRRRPRECGGRPSTSRAEHVVCAKF